MFGDSIIGFNTKVIVFNSQILVEIVDIDENFDLLELRNIIRELIVLPIVDALNYLFGQGFDVDMTSVITPSEEHLFFDVSITEIWENRSERPLEFRDLLNLLFQSQHLRRALGNLREAIRMPEDTGFFCFRAVESIKQSFKGEENSGKSKQEDKQAWGKLRNALNLHRSWIDVFNQDAGKQRHGGTVFMSGEVRISLMEHAWKVVDRFCVYLHRGSMVLPEDEFPLLTEKTAPDKN